MTRSFRSGRPRAGDPVDGIAATRRSCTVLRRRGTWPRGRVPLLLALAAQALLAPAQPSAEATALQLSDAWVRAMPPGQRMTAAYLRIENRGSAPAVVDGVEASVGKASVHETVRSDGRVRMQARASLVVPAGGVVSLAPGGLHIMLMELEATPAEGDAVTLCLTGSTPRVCVDAAVLRSAPAAADGDGATTHAHEGG